MYYEGSFQVFAQEAKTAMPMTGSFEELVVITVATKPDAYFKVLLQSCQRHNIQLTVLGVGSPWQWLCTKLNLVYRHITQDGFPPFTLFVDGYDCIFQSGVEEIWKTYKSFKSPLVVAADIDCWPAYELKNRFPSSPTRVRFVNSGGYIGETKTLVQALEIMGCPLANEHQNDQEKFAHYFVDHTREMKIDYYSEIFQTLYWVEDTVEFRAGDKAYINRSSGKKPHILHLNGTVSKNLSYARNLGYSLT